MTQLCCIRIGCVYLDRYKRSSVSEWGRQVFESNGELELDSGLLTSCGAHGVRRAVLE